MITDEEYREMLCRTKREIDSQSGNVSETGVEKFTPPTIRESAIEAECTKRLEEDGWRALRTDPVSDRGRGKGFGEVGMADHLYLRYGNPLPVFAYTPMTLIPPAICQVFWVEFKSGRHKADKHQSAWHAKERARGAMVWVANENFPATIEGFWKFYKRSGLYRGR